MITNILVIDNEMPIRKAFLKMLAHFCDDSYNIYEADSVKSGVQVMAQLKPHILFLDIELDDGTGFDFLNLVDYSGVQLIFTTAHNQYAIKAFEYSAINYLLKPISPSALQKSLLTAKEKIGNVDISNQLQVLFQTMQSPKDADQKIVLKDSNGVYFVKISEILYCEASGPYTTFVLENSQNITVSRNLKEYEHLLNEYHFVRCHHSYLVNTKKIKSIDKSEGSNIILEGQHKIPVSVRKKEELLTKLSKVFVG
jgi:two-component system, LytTR family, response regulator